VAHPGNNPYFARAMVNRTWAQLFGLGIINPVDDMHDNNPASHPELLQGMSQQFVANGFDLKFLIRAICNTQAYQRSSKPVAANKEEDPSLLGHMNIKVLTPEQLYDSLSLVLGGSNDKAGGGKAAGGRQVLSTRGAFVAFFSLDENAKQTEYGHGIPQALRLMNAPQMNSPARLADLIKGATTQTQVYEKLYLATLSRRPTQEEVARNDAYVQKIGDTKQANADILWALINCSEFTLNQ